MRHACAHEAVLVMEPRADVRALGAAVTAALCGHWDHPPLCPLAPHHTHAHRIDDEVHLRILFAAQSDTEGTVRRRIELALSGGRLQGPGGITTRWWLRSSGPSAVTADETHHAERLIRS